ncbi:hypothetical protein ACFQVA_30510 [Actinomadura keratinilytica]
MGRGARAAAPGAVLRAAARGLFPPADGGTTVLAQPDARHAGVWAFTAHSVIFLDEDPARCCAPCTRWTRTRSPPR